jgi:hypothetical protein
MAEPVSEPIRAVTPPRPVELPTPPPTPPPAPKERKYPPLPTYITRFRTEEWFKKLFPIAIPSTFDFLRPGMSTVFKEIEEQVPLSNWVDYLCSIEEVDLSSYLNRNASFQKPKRRISFDHHGKMGVIFRASIGDATEMTKALGIILDEDDVSDKDRNTIQISLLELLREQV